MLLTLRTLTKKTVECAIGLRGPGGALQGAVVTVTQDYCYILEYWLCSDTVFRALLGGNTARKHNSNRGTCR